MPRKPGQNYPVDDAWRKRVMDRLSEKGWNRADLARAAGVARSTITELLNGGVGSSTDLPKIHHALEWEWRPSAGVTDGDADSLLGWFEALDSYGRGRLMERARILFEEQAIRARLANKPH